VRGMNLNKKSSAYFSFGLQWFKVMSSVRPSHIFRALVACIMEEVRDIIH